MRSFALVAVLATATVAACRPAGGPMAPVPPPASWAADIEAERAAKVESFRHDDDSPLPVAQRAAFRGLDYYPLDPSWRYGGAIEPYPSPVRLTMVTTTGKPRPCERWGRVSFVRDGRTLTLQIYHLLDMDDRAGGARFFLPFKDATTGRATYESGRYVDLVGPDGGPFILDFNLAYNPSCAYGEPQRFQCPVTPSENTLEVAVTAGERGGVHADPASPR
jgi:uncharacterized protein (DUF1684 family)